MGRDDSGRAAARADGPSSRQQFTTRLRAMMAPVAANAGAAIDDPALLDAAAAVAAAFMRGDAAGGLTRAQIAGRVDGAVDPSTLESRLNLFVEMGMLHSQYGRKHEQRYRLNSISAVGLMVYRRLQERGGIDELRTLLDRARRLLDAGVIDRDTVAAELTKLTGLLSVFADELELMTRGAPLADLLVERRNHDHGDLLREVRKVNALVSEHAPELDVAAVNLVGEAQRYLDAVQAMVHRICDEGGDTRDFSVLDHETYFRAAKTATVAELAEVFADVVFDAPQLHVDAGRLVADLEQGSTRRRRDVRPPESPPAATEDPIAVARRRREQRLERRVRRAEQLLQGDDEADLTGWMLTAGWRGTAEAFADLSALTSDADQPYELATGDAVLVEPDSPVTHRSPTALRADRPQPNDPDGAVTEDEAAEGSRDG